MVQYFLHYSDIKMHLHRWVHKVHTVHCSTHGDTQQRSSSTVKYCRICSYAFNWSCRWDRGLGDDGGRCSLSPPSSSFLGMCGHSDDVRRWGHAHCYLRPCLLHLARFDFVLEQICSSPTCRIRRIAKRQVRAHLAFTGKEGRHSDWLDSCCAKNTPRIN